MGLEITVASAVADTLTQPETLGLSSAAVGLLATVYLAGEVVGALFFGRLSDKLGRRNLFMITLGVYLVGQRSHRVDAGQQRGLDRLPLRHPVHRRHGHRRGVRRHQLGDRRTDPGAIPRPGRYRGQRNVLGRRDPRHARHLHLPEADGPEPGLAARVPDRPGPGPGDPAGAAEPAGKPALAGHERPRGGRRGVDLAHRTRGGGHRRRAAADRRKQSHRVEAHREDRLSRADPGAVPRLPEPVDPRRLADDQPVVPVQRDLLHLHAGAGQVLRGGLRGDAAVPHRVRRRKPRRAR